MAYVLRRVQTPRHLLDHTTSLLLEKGVIAGEGCAHLVPETHAPQCTVRRMTRAHAAT
jgi:hypothetical protein